MKNALSNVLIKILIKFNPENVNNIKWWKIVPKIKYDIILQKFKLEKFKSFTLFPLTEISFIYFGLKYAKNKLLTAWIGPFTLKVPIPTSINNPIRKEDKMINK